LHIGKAQFKESPTVLLEKLHSAKTKDGKVRLPGDRTRESHTQVECDGAVDIPDKVLDKLGWR
jgi:LDH2 family malate/lactate/ureidoglycolate dehydrogenase